MITGLLIGALVSYIIYYKYAVTNKTGTYQWIFWGSCAILTTKSLSVLWTLTKFLLF